MNQQNQSIEDRQAMRRRFLEVIYAASEGNTLKFVDMNVVEAELGLNLQQAFAISKYLNDKGLVVIAGGDGVWRITPEGIDAVERPASFNAVSAFGSVVNNHIFAPHSTIGGIQQGATHSTQTVNTVNFGPQEARDVGDFVAQLKEQLPQLPLDGDAHQDASTQIAMLELQLKTGKPNKVIIGESLKTVRALLEGVAGNLIAAGLLGQLTPLFSTLGLPHH